MTHHRDLRTVEFNGEPVHFIASNDRLRERVDNLSHETHILNRLTDRLETDDVFWDIGACLGIHTLTIATHLNQGEVVGFEPMPANRGVLTDNMHANDLDNVEVAREALSNELGEADFAIRESLHAGYGRHSLDMGEYEKLKSIKVPVARGDALLGGKYPVPNAVKIDVEGAGPLVIEGMEHILRRDECHTVILETHEPNEVQPSHEDYGYTTEDIVEMLESFGFEVGTLEHHYHLVGEKPKDSDVVETEKTVEVVQGDIAEQSTDAIVNAAGTSLRMGSGVAGGLRDEAGDEINEEAIRKGPVPLGSAVTTGSYNLDSEIVVHAATMPHYGEGRATVESIRASVRDALQKADDAGCESISFPAVGCGLAGVNLERGAKTIYRELNNFNGESIRHIQFIAYTEDEYRTIVSSIENI